MQAFVVFCILALTCGGYAVDQGWLPGQMRLLPEAISAIVLLVVVVLGIRDRFRFVRPEYWFCLGALAMLMAFGVLANAVAAGAVVSGVRFYVRALPLFLLPAAYRFSDRQVGTQMRLLLAICLAQLPLTIYQKNFEMFNKNTSGDFVMGTLGDSGLLSIFLICAACVLTGFFVRRILSFPIWALFFVAVIGPTAINETKATFLLLPLGLLVTFFVASERRERLKNLFVATGVLVLVGAIIVPIYDYWAEQRPVGEGGGVTVFEFFTDTDLLDRYMNYDADKEMALLGRSAAYGVAISETLADPVRATLGLGIGNASVSSLGSAFSGEYGLQYLPVRQTTIILFLLEIGITGLVLTLCLNYLAFADARVVARREAAFWGALGGGWAGAVAVIVVSAFYTELLGGPAISYLFWYISGLLAAHRMRAAAT